MPAVTGGSAASETVAMPDDRPDTEAWRDEPLICDEQPEPVYGESEAE